MSIVSIVYTPELHRGKVDWNQLYKRTGNLKLGRTPLYIVLDLNQYHLGLIKNN